MIALRSAAAVALAAAVTLAMRVAPSRRAGTRDALAAADSFPHARHRRLFTACDACHAGIPADSAAVFPRPETCVVCHDGSLVRSVDWQPRPSRPTLLRFGHREHPELPCEICHATSDTAAFMEVGRARPEQCLACHAPEAAAHLAQVSCTPCHGALRDAAGLGAGEIARLPKPATHDSLWQFAHRRSASSPICATCHAADFCASCHVNAGSIAEIAALGSDQRVAAVARQRRVSYREPPSHRDASFTRAHGLLARQNVAQCANCHARESCLTCHREQERVAPLAQLPRRSRGGARGVDLSGIRPPDHSPDFDLRHRTAAAGGDAACSRCHASSFCASCHAGAAAPGFHPTNFVERHSELAYTRENDCAACHQMEAFCVSCHGATGQARTGAPQGRYHNAQPMWVFAHGGVARRTIESCASCHAQTDCLQCHSATRGWRVNPHGRSFDAGIGDRNRATCLICHTSGVP